MAAGVGQRSLGRTAAAHALYGRRPWYEMRDGDGDGDGMWDVEGREEYSMSDRENSGGRYWRVGLNVCTSRGRVGWTGPWVRRGTSGAP